MGKLGEGRQMQVAQPVTALGNLVFVCITSYIALYFCHADVCNWSFNTSPQWDGESESWGVKLSVVQVWSSTPNNQRGLTTSWCCKSAHVNHTNLLLPAVLVAKMTNQPLCERETRETQCRMEIWCCWDCRRSQAPHLSLPVGRRVLYTCVGGMVWATGWLSEQPSGLRTVWFVLQGSLVPWKSLQIGLLLFLLLGSSLGWPKWFCFFFFFF